MASTYVIYNAYTYTADSMELPEPNLDKFLAKLQTTGIAIAYNTHKK